MYKGPAGSLALNEEDQSYRFGVTSQTSESLMKKMQSPAVENEPFLIWFRRFDHYAQV